MLEISNLSFSYGRRKPLLFQDFSFGLQPGVVYVMLGKHGSGKSTLLYLMSGLLRPKSGTVQLNGVDVALRRPSTLQEICIVPEEFDLPRVSLRQYVALNAPFYPRFSNEILRRCLDDFDMDDSVRFDELSMGQKKKAFMSFCLAANTSILLMDEPTNGFDIPSKSQMRKVIAANMSDEKSIVISTHQVRDVENLLDHVLLIDGGRKLLDVSCSQIAERLFFVEQPLSEPIDEALYAQSSVQGRSAVYPNRTREESPINLETLFNAVLSDCEKIQAILSDK